MTVQLRHDAPAPVASQGLGPVGEGSLGSEYWEKFWEWRETNASSATGWAWSVTEDNATDWWNVSTEVRPDSCPSADSSLSEYLWNSCRW